MGNPLEHVTDFESEENCQFRVHFKTPIRVSEADEHEARMKGTNVEYRPVHAHIASVAPGFEMHS